MIIAVDFDGTITYKNAYPEVGEINPRAIEVLRKLQAQGHKLCLWTCRDWYNHTINDAIASARVVTNDPIFTLNEELEYVEVSL